LKILLAPNSFKESLSAWKVCLALEKGIRRVLSQATIYKIPIADGGQGTVESLVKATGGCLFKKRVTGPLGNKVSAYYGVPGNVNHVFQRRCGERVTAIIEMASASGLHLVPFAKRDPGIATTFGTGELIKVCLDKRCQHIMVGVGDSATTDGGVGMAQALGVRFRDKHGREIGWGGKNLKNLEYIDIEGLDKRLKKVKVTILSDVKSPLCGAKGAARVFSPQKGATPKMVLELEQGLRHLAKIIKRDLGIEIKYMPGAGAAGGLGAGLMAFLGARLVSGVDLILEFTHLKEYIKKVDLVITGEGQLDRQTIYGKAPMGVARLAKRYRCPVIGIAGTLGPGNDLLYQHGFTSLFSIMDKPMPLADAMDKTEVLLANTSERIIRLVTSLTI